MIVIENKAKSLLRKSKKIDTWFVSRYGMNLYRGCEHNCAYCDGRAEGYYVEGDFGQTVTVKVNAVEVLQRELDPRRKRKPMLPGHILLGGGVGDSYQPVEQQYGLTRRVLELLESKTFPVHILTKSVLVERDLDVLERLNSKNGVIISFSFSSSDDSLTRIFEPGAALPSAKLALIKRFKSRVFPAGFF